MKSVVGVLGLGYVGLPLATLSAIKGFKTVGYDVSDDRINELSISKTHTSKSENLLLNLQSNTSYVVLLFDVMCFSYISFFNSRYLPMQTENFLYLYLQAWIPTFFYNDIYMLYLLTKIYAYDLRIQIRSTYPNPKSHIVSQFEEPV